MATGTELNFEFEYRNQRWSEASKGLAAFAQVTQRNFDTLNPILKKQLKKYLTGVARGLRIKHSRRWPGGTSPSTLSRRSGTAVASILSSVKVTGSDLNTIRGLIGGVGYLKTHEFGAVIRPKNGKYLTIPLPAALNANGTPKFQSARQWPNTFVLKSKKGNLLIVQRVGKDIVPLYLLTDRVVIPARLGMGDALRAGVDYFVDEVMAEFVRSFVSGG